MQKPSESGEGVEVREFGVDVDDDLQTQLCHLQDMAMTTVSQSSVPYKMCDHHLCHIDFVIIIIIIISIMVMVTIF